MALRRFKDAARRVYQRGLDLLYPRGACCLICGHPRLASAQDCLCEACREALKAYRVPPQACERCLSPVEKGKPCAFCRSEAMRSIERVFSPYVYGSPVRSLIHAFKFTACGEALPLLVSPMLDSLKIRDFDCVTPVPLHPKRLRQRGFNQALLLGQSLSKETGIPLAPLLLRTRYRRPQSRTPLRSRARNVQDAFSCPSSAKGLRVLLLDDVRTSGATAGACAKALMAAGAQSVSLLTCSVVYRRPAR
ncbi:MAG: ComF family protein [Clostridia bacterium]|nr:ComF family protein [Clostridia bacterium]